VISTEKIFISQPIKNDHQYSKWSTNQSLFGGRFQDGSNWNLPQSFGGGLKIETTTYKVGS